MSPVGSFGGLSPAATADGHPCGSAGEILTCSIRWTTTSSGDKFRQETEKRFGLTAHLATRETDVLLLQAEKHGAAGFPPN